MMETIIPDETTNRPPVSADQTESTEARRPVVPDEFNLRDSENLKNIYKQIAALCRPESDEEEGWIPPSERAIEKSLNLLEQAAYSMMASNHQFPIGFVTTDYKGGLRIEWWHERSHCVTLMIDTDDESKDYIFKKLDDCKGSMNRRVLPQRFAEQLKIISQLQTGTGE